MRNIASRLVQAVFTLVGAISILFLIVRLTPGDPAMIMLGDYATPELVTTIRERYGLGVFRRFFEAIVEQCQAAGLVWGKELYFDATQVKANASLDSIAPRFAVEAHLGQLFTEWGLRLDGSCVGEYCKPAALIHIYVNGKPYEGDPAAMPLASLAEIAIVIGQPPTLIPSSWPFDTPT